MLCGDLKERKSKNQGYVYIPIADSLCGSVETNTTLESSSAPVKIKKKREVVRKSSSWMQRQNIDAGTIRMGFKFIHASGHLWYISNSKSKRRKNMALSSQSRLWKVNSISCLDRCYQKNTVRKMKTSLWVWVQQFSHSACLVYTCESTEVKMKATHTYPFLSKLHT